MNSQSIDEETHQEREQLGGTNLAQLSGSPTLTSDGMNPFGNENIVEQILRKAPTAIAYLDKNYDFVWVSLAFAKIDQRIPDEYPGKNFFDIYPGWESKPIFDRVLQSGIAYEANNQSIVLFEHPEKGTTAWNWDLYPIDDASGDITGLMLVLTNVTEHTRTATALNESQEMFAQLFEAAPDANVLMDTDGNILAVNHQTERLFGYDRTQLIGKPIEILLPKRFRQRQFEKDSDDDHHQRLQSMGIGLDILGVTKNGEQFPVDVTLSPLTTSEKVAVIAVIRDVTRQKQTERTLKEQATLLKLLQDVAFAANEATSVESAVQFALDAICTYTGWTVGHALQSEPGGKLVSMHLWHLKDPEIYADFQKTSESLIFKPGDSLPGEVFITGKPTPWMDLTTTKHFIRAEEALRVGLTSAFAFPLMVGKEIAGVLEFFTDNATGQNSVILGIMPQIGTQLGRVIERNQAQAELLRSQARFRTIFEESVLGIKLIDLEGKIFASNPAMQELLGYTNDDLDGLGFTTFTHPQDAPANIEKFNALIQGEIDHFKLEKRYIRKDGKVIWGRLTMNAVHGPDGKAQFAIGMVEDISRRKEMENELTEVQRRLLESVEAERLHMAQDLHDGPIQDLYGVNFRLQEIENELVGPSGQNKVGEIRNSVNQVVSMLRYTCGELRPPTLAPFGLEKAIRSHAEHFGESYPEIKFELKLESDGQRLPENIRLGLFRIYQQSVNNVIRHAQATRLIVRLWLDEHSVSLDVEDNGRGFELPRRWIDMARKGHLGLVGASERAEAMGGCLEIKSTPGKGTTIKAVIPLS